MTKDEFVEIWCAHAERLQNRMSPVAREHAKALNRAVASYEWVKCKDDVQELTPEEFRKKLDEQKT